MINLFPRYSRAGCSSNPGILVLYNIFIAPPSTHCVLYRWCITSTFLVCFVIISCLYSLSHLFPRRPASRHLRPRSSRNLPYLHTTSHS